MERLLGTGVFQEDEWKPLQISGGNVQDSVSRSRKPGSSRGFVMGSGNRYIGQKKRWESDYNGS